MPTIIHPDNGITFPDSTQLGSGVSLGNRNRIINGNFAINQRAYVSAVATTVANQYTLDRWRVVTSGQNLVFSASGNGNQVTAPAGGLEQVIEGINIEGGTYVCSWVGVGTLSVNGTARAKSESFTLPANTNATVRIVGVVSQFQLEPGTVTTPFEHRPIGMELALCQRYLMPVLREVNESAGTGLCVSTTNSQIHVRLPVEMRAVPTVVFSALADMILVTAGGASAGALTSLTLALGYVNMVRLDCNVASGLVGGNITNLQSATPSARLFLSAEL